MIHVRVVLKHDLTFSSFIMVKSFFLHLEAYLQKQTISVQLDVRFEVCSDDVRFMLIPRCPQA